MAKKSFTLKEYKGYMGRFKFDEEDGNFKGRIVEIDDVVTFRSRKQGKPLQKAFEEAVNKYLETCRILGKKPEKPFSGNFTVCVSPELHKKAFLKAEEEGKSLNDWVEGIMIKALK
ncbi:MAG: type II toxin-antitoxin system HicB family antitoxin [Candidatus Paceibacterota bacterium]